MSDDKMTPDEMREYLLAARAFSDAPWQAAKARWPGLDDWLIISVSRAYRTALLAQPNWNPVMPPRQPCHRHDRRSP